MNFTLLAKLVDVSLDDKKTPPVIAEINPSSPFTTSDVLLKHGGLYGTVCFVIRRPGCVLCREHALTLLSLLSVPSDGGLSQSPMHGFGLFGVIKETGVDDVGLAEFMTQAFPGQPVYRDADLGYYRALGNQKVSLMSLMYDYFFKSMGSRLKQKNLEGNLKGEGLTKGGILVFDRNQQVRYAYVEETGHDIPVTDMVAALNAVREGDVLDAVRKN
jgi:AhpC/TSA antioxidant enzyme